jgi:hypothetical protein
MDSGGSRRANIKLTYVIWLGAFGYIYICVCDTDVYIYIYIYHFQMSLRAFNLRGWVCGGWGGRFADECIRAVMRARVRLACLHSRADSLRLVQRAPLKSH